MSTGEWLALVFGVGMVVTITAICLLGKSTPDSCPNCLHDDPADETGTCLNSDAYTGWGSDKCTCAYPYHAERQASSANNGA